MCLNYAWYKMNAMHSERCRLWYFASQQSMQRGDAKLQTATNDCSGLIVSVSDRQWGTESVTALFLTHPWIFQNMSVLVIFLDALQFPSHCYPPYYRINSSHFAYLYDTGFNYYFGLMQTCNTSNPLLSVKSAKPLNSILLMFLYFILAKMVIANMNKFISVQKFPQTYRIANHGKVFT